MSRQTYVSEAETIVEAPAWLSQENVPSLPRERQRQYKNHLLTQLQIMNRTRMPIPAVWVPILLCYLIPTVQPMFTRTTNHIHQCRMYQLYQEPQHGIALRMDEHTFSYFMRHSIMDKSCHIRLSTLTKLGRTV